MNHAAITWKEALTAQREDMIKKGEVGLVVSTYSITDKLDQGHHLRPARQGDLRP